MNKRILALLPALLLLGAAAAAQTVYEIAAPAQPMSVREGHLNLGGTSPSGGSVSVNSFYMSIDG